MGVLVYILGRSGSGKSYSLRNIPHDEYAVINVEGKILPFRGSMDIEQTSTDDSEEIVKAIEKYARSYKVVVVDDFQYIMANEFMRRAYENGWDKFTEIGRHAWDIADKVRELPADVIVYVLCHTDTDAEGVERLKTIGKLLDEKIFLEGMSTIVLKTVVSDGKYSFVTQNNGKDTVKSPADMFPGYQIDNDLWYVDQKIREYYGLEVTMTDDELAEADEEVVISVDKPEKKRRGRVASGETQKEELEKAPKEEEEKPTRRTRKASKADSDKALEEQILEAEGMTRKVREPEPETEPEGEPETTPTRRRRRRA
jgi:hypothetical protein